MLALLLAAPALVLCVACDDDDDGGPTGPQTATFDWDGTIDSGDHLEIRGVNGSVVASTVAGRTATVTAQLRGNGDDVTTVDVEVVQHAGGVLICAIYPDVAGEPPNSCDPEAPEVYGSSRVTVDFLVEVPSDVLYAAVVVNGDLTAMGLERPATLVTVNGSIDAGTTSLLTAVTVNGSVDATLDGLTLPDPWTLTTVNGSIAARVPGTIDADVAGATVNGTMSSDFPLTETSPGEWSGTIGAGGPLITLTAVNGNLSLVRTG
jgi:polyisoprenoid-binding protein YceI